MTRKVNSITIHSYRRHQCDVCKELITERIRVRKEVINLVAWDKLDYNYIAIESISRDILDLHHIYLIPFKDKSFIRIVRILIIKGRSNTSDLMLTDATISRSHAFIKIINGSFYIEDNYSKYGTLALVNSPVDLLPYKGFSIQIARFSLCFVVKKRFCAYFKCLYYQFNLGHLILLMRIIIMIRL